MFWSLFVVFELVPFFFVPKHPPTHPPTHLPTLPFAMIDNWLLWCFHRTGTGTATRIRLCAFRLRRDKASSRRGHDQVCSAGTFSFGFFFVQFLVFVSFRFASVRLDYLRFCAVSFRYVVVSFRFVIVSFRCFPLFFVFF